MTKQPLHHKKVSTHLFLVNKTDAKSAGLEKKYKERRSKNIEGKPFAYPDALKEKFPEMYSGKAFIEHADSQIASWEHFHTLAIKMDDFETKEDQTRREHAFSVLFDIGNVIHKVCISCSGFWGLVDRNIFGCCFPDSEKPDLRKIDPEKIADDINAALAELREETVTIGIATYPTIQFKKDLIFKNALKAIHHAAFYGPSSTVSFDAVSLNVSGDIMYQKGDIKDALNEFETALLLDPSNTNIHNSLGVCYGVMKDYDKALNAFDTAHRLDPGEFMAVYNIGLIQMLKGDREQALTRFKEANTIDKNVFEVLFQTGRLYLEMEQPEDARKYLEKAVKLNNQSGAVYRLMGECYDALSLTEEAVHAYKQAIKQNPNDAASLSALGHLFDVIGENSEIALTFCRQSVDISPEKGLFRYRLGAIYYKLDQLENALQEFEAAHELGHDALENIEKIRTLLDPENNATLN